VASSPQVTGLVIIRRKWQGASVGGTLGLLLDLNQGSLTVYVNGRRIGVAVPSGSLVGPQYWAADVYCHADGRSHNAVTITRKPPP
jgi:hypothetical protein